MASEVQEDILGYDQKDSSVFRVARGTSGRWDVTEVGHDKPLASFNTRQDAREHARDRAKRKGNFADRVQDEPGAQIPADSSAVTRNRS